jgi:sulfate transporter 4
MTNSWLGTKAPKVNGEQELLGSPQGEGDPFLRRRHPFVSGPRQVLEHVQKDSLHARRHAVSHEVPSKSDITERKLSRRLCHAVLTYLGGDGKKCKIETVVPAWSWLKSYPWKTTFSQDLIAGLTVGVMVIPQGMSYAKLAGLPVEYGLYSALMPIYAYSLFGTSRQLAVGPVALISLLLSTGLSTVLEKEGIDTSADDYQERYNRLAVQVSFLVGVCYIVMGVLRLGFVTIFLSHAVISGFTTGAAVIIGMSQIKYIFGYSIPRSDRLQEVLHLLWDGIDKFNWKTFLLGTISICALAACKNIGKTFPRLKFARALGPLSVTAISIVLSVLFSFSEKGIPVVGNIPRGLPKFTASLWTPLGDISELLLVVASIAVVGFMESVAIAKQLASKHKYDIDSSQELIGLGVSVSAKVPNVDGIYASVAH